MIDSLFTLQSAASLCNGQLIKGKEQSDPGGFCIDSRKAAEGFLFVPLKGENTDGHLFISAAVKGGCSAFFCSEDYFIKNEINMTDLAGHCMGLIIVQDPLKAMQKVAAGHVARFPYLKKIGVTGSSGKTTTRRLIAAVLGSAADTVQTEGNLNSGIGLPMSVLQINSSHEYAVFEMGINHPGEMDDLAHVFRPQFGVYTNIGTAHIGILGSRDNIAEEKRKMMSCADSEGCVFVYEEDEFADYLSENVKSLTFGIKSQEIGDIEDLGIDGCRFSWKGKAVNLKLAGKHNLINALAALKVAEYFNIDAGKAAAALSGVGPIFGRSEILKGEITVIQDCYNANPESMSAALDFVSGLDVSGRKIVVLGEMKELGGKTRAGHEQLASLAVSMNFDFLVLFGDSFRQIADSLNKYEGSIKISDNFDEVVEHLDSVTEPGDLVFLKGSRGIALERISEKLKKRYALC